MDDDLDTMDRPALVAEVRKLRGGIRDHRDQTGHGLCWHHPELWSLLPEKTEPSIKAVVNKFTQTQKVSVESHR